jgi:hypothetical protein
MEIQQYMQELLELEKFSGLLLGETENTITCSECSG